MAEILSRQYQGVFSQPVRDPASANFEPRNSANILTDIEITEPQLVSAMKDMKSSSSPGPEAIPASLNKEFEDKLARPLLAIWRQSLDSGLMLEGTLVSIITPIYKGATRHFSLTIDQLKKDRIEVVENPTLEIVCQYSAMSYNDLQYNELLQWATLSYLELLLWATMAAYNGLYWAKVFYNDWAPMICFENELQ